MCAGKHTLCICIASLACYTVLHTCTFGTYTWTINIDVRVYVHCTTYDYILYTNYGTHDYIDGDYARITITSWQNKLKYYTYQNTVTMVRLLYCLHYLKSTSYYFQHFLVFYNINGLAKNHCVPKLMVESRTTRLFFSAATSST